MTLSTAQDPRSGTELPTCTHLRVRYLGACWSVREAPPAANLRAQLDLALRLHYAEVPELSRLPGTVEDLDVFWMGPHDGIAAYHPDEEHSYVFRAQPTTP